MAALSDFYRYITMDVPGCPQPVVDQAIVDTAIDFCTRTGAWKAWTGPVTTVAEVNTYDIDLPTNAIVRQVEAVAVGTKQMGAISDLLETGAMPNWQDNTGQPTQATYDDENKVVRVIPTPTLGNETMRFLVSFIPTYNAATVPDVLLKRYARGFSAGVRSMLQLQRQSWADPASAQINQGIYEDAIRGATAYTTRQGMRMPLRSKAVP